MKTVALFPLLRPTKAMDKDSAKLRSILHLSASQDYRVSVGNFLVLHKNWLNHQQMLLQGFCFGEMIVKRLQVREITGQSAFVLPVLSFVPVREARQKGKHNALNILRFLHSDSLSIESTLQGLSCSPKMKGMWPDSFWNTALRFQLFMSGLLFLWMSAKTYKEALFFTLADFISVILRQIEQCFYILEDIIQVLFKGDGERNIIGKQE